MRTLALQVRPDGKAFALWFAVQGDALVAWRTVTGEPTALKGYVTRELAWAPDGLYFVALHKMMDGDGEIWRYQWQGQPELVIDRSRLHGYPVLLAWDAARGRLLFADREGMHAATADGKEITSLACPWGTGASQSGTFAPGHLRYVTLRGDEFVLGTAGQAAATPLLRLPDHFLQRVAWMADGQTLAVEGTERGRPAPEIIVVSAPPDGPARILRRLPGSQPALLGDSLWYLTPDPSTAMRLRLPTGELQALAGTGRVYALSADTAAQRLYLFQDSGAAPILTLDVRGLNTPTQG